MIWHFGVVRVLLEKRLTNLVGTSTRVIQKCFTTHQPEELVKNVDISTVDDVVVAVRKT